MTKGERYAKRIKWLTHIPAWVGIIFDAQNAPDRLVVRVRMFIPLIVTTLVYQWDIPASKFI